MFWRPRPDIAYLLLTGCLLAFLAFAAARPGGVDDQGASLIAFVGVLPLANAFFDSLSIGLTRYALRHALRLQGAWAVIVASADLLAALALFIALKVAALAIVLGLNLAAGGGPQDGVLDLLALFTDMRAHPQDYWWLYLGFATTLLPTLAHGFIALWSVGAWLPQRAGAALAGLIPRMERDKIDATVAGFFVPLYATLAVFLPVFLGWLAWRGLVAVYPDAAWSLFRLLTGIAGWADAAWSGAGP